LPQYKTSQTDRRQMTDRQTDIARLDAFLKQCKRYRYCPDDYLEIADLFSDADDQLFSRILHTQGHVLKPLLPNHTQHHYNLRDRSHNFELITKNAHVNDATLLSDNCSKTCTNNFFVNFYYLLVLCH